MSIEFNAPASDHYFSKRAEQPNPG